MNNDTLIKIIKIIKKYNLENCFNTPQDFTNWSNSLNERQINNFLSLDIEIDNEHFPLKLLTNLNLLNCIDFKEKLKSLLSLKNIEGCAHLLENICVPNFLNSKNFYKDIELVATADTARYCLWILGKDEFINSPYHNEDLKLLVETHDISTNEVDFVVSDALATVASNKDSINSPYHEEDMKLIASVGSDYLQPSHTYPEHSLNNLATNKNSLKDKYHLENMEILSKNYNASEFLIIIMTDPRHIKSRYYRDEVNALANAKSKLTARALYYFIENPKNKYTYDMDFYDDYESNIEHARIFEGKSISGSKLDNYIEYLELINQIDDEYVMHFVSILMNQELADSPYREFDLDLLLKTKDILTFMELYRYLISENSIDSPYHIEDATMIVNAKNEGIRDLLLKKATSDLSLESIYHRYDMNYINELNLDEINEKIYEHMMYFLFKRNGLLAPDHIEVLESLKQGVILERKDQMKTYLDELETELTSSPCIEVSKPTLLTLLKRKFKRK